MIYDIPSTLHATWQTQMPRVECLQESHVNVGKSERETDKQANMPDGIET